MSMPQRRAIIGAFAMAVVNMTSFRYVPREFQMAISNGMT
jgi:hypothetical protein